MTILVTDATGTIGGRLVDRLVAAGEFEARRRFPDIEPMPFVEALRLALD